VNSILAIAVGEVTFITKCMDYGILLLKNRAVRGNPILAGCNSILAGMARIEFLPARIECKWPEFGALHRLYQNQNPVQINTFYDKISLWLSS